MSTRRAIVLFLLVSVYCGLPAWPVAWWFQESGGGGPGSALGVLIVLVGCAGLVGALIWACRGRRRQFGARIRANDGLMSWGYGVLIPIGTLLGLFNPDWARTAGLGLTAVGTGLMLWVFIQSIPVTDPPDDVAAPASS